MAFRYTDAEWSKILTELSTLPHWESFLNRLSGLPQDEKISAEMKIRGEYRAQFEAEIDEWQHFGPQHRKAKLKACKATQKAVQAIKKSYKDPLTKSLFRARDAFVSQAIKNPLAEPLFPAEDTLFLRRLDLIELQASLEVKRAKGPIGYNKHKDALLTTLLAAWLVQGGRSASSTGADGQTPDGPYIRFLMAAARPAGIPLTPHAARKYKQKSTPWLLKMMGAKAIDDIPDHNAAPAWAAVKNLAQIVRNPRRK